MGKKLRSQQRKKDSDAVTSGAVGSTSGGGGVDTTMLDSEFLSDDYTIADSVTTFASNFDELGGGKIMTNCNPVVLLRFTEKSQSVFYIFPYSLHFHQQQKQHRLGRN